MNHAGQFSTWTEETLFDWISSGPTTRDERQFLEGHVELIDSRTLDHLEALSNLEFDEPEDYEILGLCWEVMHDILARGHDSLSAIRDSYVNLYGGLVLDIPPWLELLGERLAELPLDQSSLVAAETRARLLREALARAVSETGVAPEIIAELSVELADVLTKLRDSNKSRRYEEALALVDSALRTYSKTRYPLQHAIAQSVLGSIYASRDEFDSAANLERSIQAYEAALECVSQEDAPVIWARVQQGRADVYRCRKYGDPRENIRQGIECCEAALEVFIEDQWPDEWAQTMNVLGNLYQGQATGAHRESLERAIDCYRAALRAIARDTQPFLFATIQNNLGQAFTNRVGGDQALNAELAVNAFAQALSVFTKDTHPIEYATVLRNRAGVAVSRSAFAMGQYLVSAIADLKEAIQIYSLAGSAEHYAAAQSNLGAVYAHVLSLRDFPMRFSPGGASEAADHHQLLNKDQAIEDAIRANQEALKVYSPGMFPTDYARTMQNLGSVYAVRRQGARDQNLEAARRCFEAAERIYAPDMYPHEYRLLLLNQASAEEGQQNWLAAHELHARIYALEERLLRQEVEGEGKASLIREDRSSALRDGYALARLGRYSEAAVAIERGRAREYSEGLVIETADANRIHDDARRQRFDAARQRLTETQDALYAPLSSLPRREAMLQEWEQSDDRAGLRQTETVRLTAYQAARRFFDKTVAEIRAAGDPGDFLLDVFDADTILRASASLRRGHAIVYLVATYSGGVAIGAFSGSASSDAATDSAHFAALDLPDLTLSRVVDIAVARIYDDPIASIGGFTYAQRGLALTGLYLPTWQGETLRERARSLQQVSAGAHRSSALSLATQLALQIPEVAQIADRPLASLSDLERSRLEASLNFLFLRIEIDGCLRSLRDVGMKSLYDWIRNEGATSVTLVPCGLLESFPLSAVMAENDHTFAELMPTSIAPNARALLQGRQVNAARSGIFALGDPRPSHQVLRWGEAEARTLAKLAYSSGHQGEAHVQLRATRRRLVGALNTSLVVSASCHGAFDELDFLRSRLLLANGESLTLSDILSHQVDARGLRLFILSACQTAIPDVRAQTDEVRSVAAAMIQAGSHAVLGSLWPVDDKATYLLIVRFAQEWLPNLREPPAEALARAQRWLRTVTNRDLRSWEATILVGRPESDAVENGSGRREGLGWESSSHVAEDAREVVDLGITVRGGGNRYAASEAELLQRTMASVVPSDDRPFADPIYWAAFQIVGW